MMTETVTVARMAVYGEEKDIIEQFSSFCFPLSLAVLFLVKLFILYRAPTPQFSPPRREVTKDYILWHRFLKVSPGLEQSTGLGRVPKKERFALCVIVGY